MAGQLLKKEHQGVIAQFLSLDVLTFEYSIFIDLQKVTEKYSKVFEYITKGIPPPGDHDHPIHLILGSVPPNIKPCKDPYGQKTEIEHMVEEMLEASIIMAQPNFLLYTSGDDTQEGWIMAYVSILQRAQQDHH